MIKSASFGRCPVCGMTETNESQMLDYRGIKHYFCSSQCRDRFEAHPHLYVGDPQHGLSVKQRGEVVAKRQKLRLSRDLSDEVKERLQTEVGILMGILDLAFDGANILVTYDLLQISLEDIEKAIVQSACQLNDAITDRIRRSVIHYSEACELENLAHLTKDGGCH